MSTHKMIPRSTAKRIAKVLQLKTEAPARVVIRDRAGKKLFYVDLPGVSITVAVPSSAEIKLKSRKGDPK